MWVTKLIQINMVARSKIQSPTTLCYTIKICPITTTKNSITYYFVLYNQDMSNPPQGTRLEMVLFFVVAGFPFQEIERETGKVINQQKPNPLKISI
jgi:hypothetical protein